MPAQAAGFGTLAFAVEPLQNGPDGLALVDSLGGVLQFLSYGSRLTAADGPATGLSSETVHLVETSLTPANASLALTGRGIVYSDFNWTVAATSTFGFVNENQSFAPAPPAAPLSVPAMPPFTPPLTPPLHPPAAPPAAPTAVSTLSPPWPPISSDCFVIANDGRHWCGLTHPGQAAYDAASGAPYLQDGDTWGSDGKNGWRFCGLSLEACQQACVGMGGCAELSVASNGCCFPATSQCEGARRPNDDKYYATAC